MWADVDFEAGLIRVHRQLSRQRVHAKLKTPAARREVVLAPAVVRLLRERWIASPHTGPEDLIFCTSAGRGLDYRDVGDAFRAAVRRVGLTGRGRISVHSLRHGFASLLIAKGLDVVFVSRQLGHSTPAVTLSTYAHKFREPRARPGRQGGFGASYEAMAGTTGR